MESATATQRDQWLVEHQIRQIYDIFSTIPPNAQSVMLEIQRDSHIDYLTKGLEKLGHSFCVLDANRPWLCYWILHSIALLGESVDDNLKSRTIDFLNRCQDPDGGYGGGPGQLPHLATTYAAVNTLITLCGEEAFLSINRGKLYSFLKQMKDPSGAFRMHDGGEIDVRACYTAISVASVLNILDDKLVQDVGDYILSCQTFEGGISGEPGSEAHGGYTFCGLAAMILIDEVQRLDLPSLFDWVVYRQSGAECGFQGRTNKLVDGCYSFWQGGVCALSQRLRSVVNGQLGLSDADEYSDTYTSETDTDISEGNLEKDTDIQERDATQVPDICPTKSGAVGLHNACCPIKFKDVGYEFIKGHARMEPLYHSIALQQYIILCSQLQDGGFRDKPGKGRDFYHTCYCLSGLSVCQYAWSRDEKSAPLPRAVLGPYDNILETVHPLYNVVLGRYYEAHNYFFQGKTPSPV